jgi:hypothetical protein
MLLSKGIAAYEIEDFMNKGFKNIILENQKASNEMWEASFSVYLPKA